MTLAIDELERLARSLATVPAARGNGQPDPSLRILDDVLQDCVGHKVMTILKIDSAQMWSERIYSSHPLQFALHRRKALSTAPQMQRVIAAGEPLLVNGEANVRAAFPDAQRILDSGCASVLNIPVRLGHRFIANVNLLHDADHYESSTVEALKLANCACQMIGGLLLTRFGD